MLPYIVAGPWQVGPFRIHAFALMMATALLVGHFGMIARARRTGLDPKHAAEMNLAMVACGFTGAVLFKLLYHPDVLEYDLWTLIRYHLAISSFGGVFGGLLGALGYLRFSNLRGEAAWRYMDVAGFVFPFAWIFGRMGCSIVHDHPGMRGSGWLTVAYPDGARYDLAVLEVFFVGLLIPAFVILNRRPRRPGFYLALFLTLYGPFRIAIDRLHVDPQRYWGISVDQWAGAMATAAGVSVALAITRGNRRDRTPASATM